MICCCIMICEVPEIWLHHSGQGKRTDRQPVSIIYGQQRPAGFWSSAVLPDLFRGFSGMNHKIRFLRTSMLCSWTLLAVSPWIHAPVSDANNLKYWHAKVPAASQIQSELVQIQNIIRFLCNVYLFWRAQEELCWPILHRINWKLVMNISFSVEECAYAYGQQAC